MRDASGKRVEHVVLVAHVLVRQQRGLVRDGENLAVLVLEQDVVALDGYALHALNVVKFKLGELVTDQSCLVQELGQIVFVGCFCFAIGDLGELGSRYALLNVSVVISV